MSMGGIQCLSLVWIESTWLIWHCLTVLLVISMLRRSDTVRPESMKTCEKDLFYSLQQPLRATQRLLSSTDISAYFYNQRQFPLFLSGHFGLFGYLLSFKSLMRVLKPFERLCMKFRAKTSIKHKDCRQMETTSLALVKANKSAFGHSKAYWLYIVFI